MEENRRGLAGSRSQLPMGLDPLFLFAPRRGSGGPCLCIACGLFSSVLPLRLPAEINVCAAMETPFYSLCHVETRGTPVAERRRVPSALTDETF